MRIQFYNMTDHLQINEQSLDSAVDLRSGETQLQFHQTPDVAQTDTTDIHSVDYNDNLDIILKQKYPVTTLTWNGVDTVDEVLTSFYPISSFLSQSRIAAALSQRKGIKSTFQVTITATVPPNLRGCLLITAYPTAFANPRPTWENAHTYSDYQLHHTYMLDASNNAPIVFDLPPTYVEEYMMLHSYTGRHWALSVKVIAPLKGTLSTTVPEVSIRIYVNALDPKLVGLIPESVSGKLETLSKGFSAMSMPISSAVAKTASTVADYFGYSKPVNTVVTLANVSQHHVLATDAPDTSEIVSLFTTHGVKPLKQTDPEKDVDIMSFDFLENVETLIYRGTLINATPIRIPVCIGNFPSNTSGPSGVKWTGAFYCAFPFKWYRVDQFIFDIKIFSSPNVSGYLYVFFVPHVDLTDIYNTSWDVDTRKVAISLTGSSCSTVTVNWNASRPVLPVRPVEEETAITPTNGTIPTNGMLYLYPGPIASTGGMDTQLNFDVTLRTKGLKVVSLNDRGYNTNVGTFGELSLTRYLVTESKTLQYCTWDDLTPKTVFDVDGELSGEGIKSMRALAQRPSKLATVAVDPTDGGSTIGYMGFMRFPTPATSSDGVLTYETGDCVTITENMTYAAYALAPYVGYRCSTRHSIVPLRTNMQRVDLGAAIVRSNFDETPRIICFPSNDLKGKPLNNQNRFTDGPGYGGYTSLADDGTFRVSFPYSQQLKFYPSCWSYTDSELSWDNYSIAPWAAMVLREDKPMSDTSTNTKWRGQLSFDVFLSTGDDLSVFHFRGIPQFTIPA